MTSDKVVRFPSEMPAPPMKVSGYVKVLASVRTPSNTCHIARAPQTLVTTSVVAMLFPTPEMEKRTQGVCTVHPYNLAQTMGCWKNLTVFEWK